MEDTWWHFSQTWKEEVIQPPSHGQGRRKRTLSFSRSRHLMDYPKVVAFLSAGPGREQRCEERIYTFLAREAKCTALDFDAAAEMAEEVMARARHGGSNTPAASSG
eukprot:12188254-Alexandrium_andersonii.AAC.1